MSRQFPIHSREWHEEALRKMDEFEPTDPEARILITWHSTAVNYWAYGSHFDLDGPAAEVDGKPVLIKPYFQLGIDEYGSPYMRHFPADDVQEQRLERFDVQGVSLRDVRIRVVGDKIRYSIPDTIDQGGAVRQFEKPFSIGENKLGPPVLKSDIQEACEVHCKEGGLSDG